MNVLLWRGLVARHCYKNVAGELVLPKKFQVIEFSVGPPFSNKGSNLASVPCHYVITLPDVLMTRVRNRIIPMTT